MLQQATFSVTVLIYLSLFVCTILANAESAFVSRSVLSGCPSYAISQRSRYIAQPRGFCRVITGHSQTRPTSLLSEGVTRIKFSPVFQDSPQFISSIQSRFPSRATTSALFATPITILDVPGRIDNNPLLFLSLMVSDGGDAESWRQYVPLVVSVGVIVDILLGSPLANLALGPMRRASQKGVTGDKVLDESDDSSSSGENAIRSSLFSSFGNSSLKADHNVNAASQNRERVDSEAIAKAAIDKARNTMELRQFLEENKSDEQRYEEIRRKIDQQIGDLEES